LQRFDYKVDVCEVFLEDVIVCWYSTQKLDHSRASNLRKILHVIRSKNPQHPKNFKLLTDFWG